MITPTHLALRTESRRLRSRVACLRSRPGTCGRRHGASQERATVRMSMSRAKAACGEVELNAKRAGTRSLMEPCAHGDRDSSA